ncbi:unnamed protein product, partial [marine sediment metagenome]
RPDKWKNAAQVRRESRGHSLPEELLRAVAPGSIPPRKIRDLTLGAMR